MEKISFHRWNELIGQSSSLMEKLPLQINGSDWRSINKETKSFNRKYRTIKIRNCKIWNKTALKVIQKKGVKLRKLGFYDCSFRSLHSKFLNNLFSSVSKLEVLECIQTATYETTFKSLKTQDLPKLKRLVMTDSQMPVR